MRSTRCRLPARAPGLARHARVVVLAGAVPGGDAQQHGQHDAGDHAAGILDGSTQTALKRLRIDVAGDDAYEQHRRKKRQKATGSHESS